jgi:hypothetical protein
MAPDVLERLSRAAVKAGIGCTVVTAAHWARGRTGIAKVLDRFAHIERWHLSTDVFHTKFIPAAQVLSAAQAARERGHRVVIRTAVDKPPSSEQIDLYNQIKAQLPAGADVEVEPVLHAGRAARMPHVPYPRWRRSVPCISTGPVIHEDGAVSPCCGGLTDNPNSWPWPFPDASTTPLAEVQRSWSHQPVLRLIRAVGFAPILRWVADEVGEDEMVTNPPDHPCAVCISLWRDPRAVAAVTAKVDDAAVQAKIGELYDAVFTTRRVR